MHLREKHTLRHILFLFLAIIMVSAMVAYIGFSEFIDNLREIDVIYLPLIVGIYSLGWLLRTSRLHFLTRSFQASCTYGTIFRINIGENALNIILPARIGDVLAAIALKRYISLPKGIASIIHIRVLDLLALLSLGFMVLLFLEVPNWAVSAFILAVIIIGGGLSFILVFNRTTVARTSIQKLSSGLMKKVMKQDHDQENSDKLPAMVEELTSSYESLLSPKLMSLGIALSLGIWICDSLVAYLVARGIGHECSFNLILMAVIFANLTKAVPSTPGGMGVFEMSMAALLTFGGVEREIAVTISVVHHLILNLFTLVVGVPGISKIGVDVFGRKLYGNDNPETKEQIKESEKGKWVNGWKGGGSS